MKHFLVFYVKTGNSMAFGAYGMSSDKMPTLSDFSAFTKQQIPGSVYTSHRELSKEDMETYFRGEANSANMEIYYNLHESAIIKA